jgi:hypothetical protein
MHASTRSVEGRLCIWVHFFITNQRQFGPARCLSAELGQPGADNPFVIATELFAEADMKLSMRWHAGSIVAPS